MYTPRCAKGALFVLAPWGTHGSVKFRACAQVIFFTQDEGIFFLENSLIFRNHRRQKKSFMHGVEEKLPPLNCRCFEKKVPNWYRTNIIQMKREFELICANFTSCFRTLPHIRRGSEPGDRDADPEGSVRPFRRNLVSLIITPTLSYRTVCNCLHDLRYSKTARTKFTFFCLGRAFFSGRCWQ